MGSCFKDFILVRIKRTFHVIFSIFWQLVFVLIYTIAICCIYYYVPSIKIAYPSTLIEILGVVISLLLAFQIDNAYDRYWEARKLWTSLTQEIRKLTRAIWLGVDRQSGSPKSLIERKTALNLCIGYVIALKHYLREEYSYDYEDLKDYVRHLPKISLREQNSYFYKKYKLGTPTNIPVEISYYLTNYVKYLQGNKLAEEWAISDIRSSLSTLVDCLGNFERIFTPIPVAYSTQLILSVWIYILALPFQVVGDIGWFAIPCVGLCAFCLIGMFSIGVDIEDPFGYDENDLTLDDFCTVIKLEVQMVMDMKILDTEEWLFSKENYLFGPENPNATEINNMCKEEVDELLSKITKKPVLTEMNFEF